MRQLLLILVLLLFTICNGSSCSMWGFLAKRIKYMWNGGEMDTSKSFVTPTPACPAAASNLALHSNINGNSSHRFITLAPHFNATKRYAIAVLVISAAWEQEDRRDIRKLWASVNESQMQKEGESLVIFVVGRSTELDEEAAANGDLLQVDIEETYRNLVYKIEAGYRWFKENVKSEFVLKTDSDTVVHIDRLHGQMRRLEKEESGDWMGCHAGIGYEPHRDTCSPWYVSFEDYPLSSYPDFCRGGGYVMKRETFDKIVESMGNFHIFEAEDVFFTGHVASNIEGLVIKDGITAIPYTNYFECDEFGPVVSILNTHHQIDSEKQSLKNLTAAWERLKNPRCHKFWTRLFKYK